MIDAAERVEQSEIKTVFSILCDSSFGEQEHVFLGRCNDYVAKCIRFNGKFSTLIRKNPHDDGGDGVSTCLFGNERENTVFLFNRYPVVGIDSENIRFLTGLELHKDGKDVCVTDVRFATIGLESIFKSNDGDKLDVMSASDSQSVLFSLTPMHVDMLGLGWCNFNSTITPEPADSAFCDRNPRVEMNDVAAFSDFIDVKIVEHTMRQRILVTIYNNPFLFKESGDDDDDDDNDNGRSPPLDDSAPHRYGISGNAVRVADALSEYQNKHQFHPLLFNSHHVSSASENLVLSSMASSSYVSETANVFLAVQEAFSVLFVRKGKKRGVRPAAVEKLETDIERSLSDENDKAIARGFLQDEIEAYAVADSVVSELKNGPLFRRHHMSRCAQKSLEDLAGSRWMDTSPEFADVHNKVRSWLYEELGSSVARAKGRRLKRKLAPPDGGNARKKQKTRHGGRSSADGKRWSVFPRSLVSEPKRKTFNTFAFVIASRLYEMKNGRNVFCKLAKLLPVLKRRLHAAMSVTPGIDYSHPFLLRGVDDNSGVADAQRETAEKMFDLQTVRDANTATRIKELSKSKNDAVRCETALTAALNLRRSVEEQTAFKSVASVLIMFKMCKMLMNEQQPLMFCNTLKKMFEWYARIVMRNRVLSAMSDMPSDKEAFDYIHENPKFALKLCKTVSDSFEWFFNFDIWPDDVGSFCALVDVSGPSEPIRMSKIPKHLSGPTFIGMDAFGIGISTKNVVAFSNLVSENSVCAITRFADNVKSTFDRFAVNGADTQTLVDREKRQWCKDRFQEWNACFKIATRKLQYLLNTCGATRPSFSPSKSTKTAVSFLETLRNKRSFPFDVHRFIELYDGWCAGGDILKVTSACLTSVSLACGDYDVSLACGKKHEIKWDDPFITFFTTFEPTIRKKRER